MTPMASLIGIEWKKLAFQCKYQLLIPGVILLGILFSWQQRIYDFSDHGILTSKYSEMQIVMQKINSRMSLSDEMLTEVSGGGKTVDEIRADHTSQLNLCFTIASACEADDWRKVLETENELLEAEREGMLIIKDSVYTWAQDGKSMDALTEEIEKNRYYLAQEMNPFEEESKTTGMKGLCRYLQEVFPILFPVLVLILSAEMISKERKDNTIRYLLQQPCARAKLLVSKYLAVLAGAVLLLALALVVAFAALSILYGVGSAAYPVVSRGIFGENFRFGGVSYQTTGWFLVNNMLYCFLGILFYIVFGGLISVFGRSELTVITAISIPYVVWLIINIIPDSILRQSVFSLTDSYDMIVGTGDLLGIGFAALHIAVLGGVCMMVTIWRLGKLEA